MNKINQALHDAVWFCKPLAHIKQLIEKGANVNAKDEDSWSVLQGAVSNNNGLDIIKYLGDQGADVNAKNKKSRSVLHSAVWNNNGLPIIKYLVEQGANVNAKNEDSRSVLHFAVWNNNALDIIKYLVEQGADVNAKDKDSWSVLHRAVWNKNELDFIKYLVDQGADVNAKDEDSLSVLHTAVRNNNELEIIKYLVDQGADVNAKDDDSWSVLHRAVANKNKLEIIKYLVDQGADVNAKDNNSNGVLYFAVCFKNELVIIKYLVDQGADVNAKDKDSCSVLHRAVKENNELDIIKYLIEEGADVNNINNKGVTINETAAKVSQEVLYYIITCQKAVEVKLMNRQEALRTGNFDKYAPFLNEDLTVVLRNAVKHNQLETIKFLISRSKFHNLIVDQSLIETAIKNNAIEVVKVLINKIDPFKLLPGEAFGKDIIAIATKENCEEIVTFLQEYYLSIEIVKQFVDKGGSLTAVNKNGESIISTLLNGKDAVLNFISEYQNQQDVLLKSAKLVDAMRAGKLDEYDSLLNNMLQNELLQAVQLNHPALVRYLLKKSSGIPINQELIFIAIQNESIEIVKMLITELDQSKLLPGKKYGQDILGKAKQQNCEEIINFLEEYYSNVQELFNKVHSH